MNVFSEDPALDRDFNVKKIVIWQYHCPENIDPPGYCISLNHPAHNGLTLGLTYAEFEALYIEMQRALNEPRKFNNDNTRKVP